MPAFLSRAAILLSVLAMIGCEKAIEQEDVIIDSVFEEDAATDPVSQEDASADPFFEEQSQLEQVRNEYPLKQGNGSVEIKPAKSRREDRIFELIDLGLNFRLITFDKPLEGNSSVFFSETEITNRMYANYLKDMNQMRDDAELAEASAIPINSTAGAFVNVDSEADLWRTGAMPSDREDHPVSLVTVSQGMAFCDWLNDRYSLDGNFRLPFGEEWVFAAYGTDRQYPWGDEEQSWYSNTTHAVNAHPELQTPDGLFGMWGNVSELVLSRSDGYGGTVKDDEVPFITIWQGASYRDRKADPGQDYWGYTHSSKCRDSERGFRVCFVPKKG